ncbi:hypothetical protein GC387_02685 [Pseudomonas sp. MWU12-2323]|nr:hypothetical protein [Pseudomonas sp. MWU12-2323]
MLAMDVNDDAGVLAPRGAWTTIASKLAPTIVLYSLHLGGVRHVPCAADQPPATGRTPGPARVGDPGLPFCP